MEVLKVERDDTKIIDFIIENLIDNSNEKPSAVHLETLLTDDRTYLLAAIIDNKVVGYCLAYKFPSLYTTDYLAYLYDIEVLEKYRRKGVGRLLIETLLTHLKCDGVTELWLGTAINNVGGQALFSSTGGIRSGETFNDFTYDLQDKK